MKYLTCTAGPQDMFLKDPPNTVRIKVGGTNICVPVHEFSEDILLPLLDLKGKTEGERRLLIYKGFRQAQVRISTRLYRAARDVATASDGVDFLTLVPLTTPTCLSKDSVEFRALGWVFWTTVGILGTNVRPDCFEDFDGDDKFPFWAAEPRVPPDPSAYFQTPEGKAKLARQLAVCLGYGPAPKGALTPPELTSGLIPQE